MGPSTLRFTASRSDPSEARRFREFPQPERQDIVATNLSPSTEAAYAIIGSGAGP